MEIIKEKCKLELRSHVSSCKVVDRAFHWHEYYEISQVIKKPCRFLVDGKSICANEGDIIAVSEQTVHKFIVDYDDTVIRTIQFPLKMLLNVNHSIKPLKCHITLDEINKIPGLSEKLNTVFSLMDEENNDALKLEDNLFLQSLFSSLYFLLMRHFSGNENIGSKSERREFHRIAKFINENFEQNINVKMISENLYIPQRKITTVFKQYSGVELKEYINTLRIKKANELLKEGHTISEAAFGSGFQCIRSFNNIYKNLTGITPSEYLKEYVQN